jgi:hypothetical protein
MENVRPKANTAKQTKLTTRLNAIVSPLPNSRPEVARAYYESGQTKYVTRQ